MVGAETDGLEFEVTTRGLVTLAADAAPTDGSLCEDVCADPGEPVRRDVCVLVFAPDADVFALVDASVVCRPSPFTANEPS